jgi:hypothetical protein
MSILNFSENWDGVTPPAIPAGWNVSAQLTTSALGAAHSGPNVLSMSGSASTWYYATYGTGDSSAVQFQLTGYMQPLTKTNPASVALLFNGSNTTLDHSTTSYYQLRIFQTQIVGPPDAGVYLEKVVSGTTTVLTSTSSGMSWGVWYAVQIQGQTSGSNMLVTVTISRSSDGFFYNSSGVFQSGFANWLTSYSISSALTMGTYGYAGYSANGTGIYFDDFSILTSDTTPAFRQLVSVTRLPGAYYLDPFR